jgi:hypothetical protein
MLEVAASGDRFAARLADLAETTEHLDAAFDPRGDVLVREADGRFRVRLSGNPLPVLFTLRATR